MTLLRLTYLYLHLLPAILILLGQLSSLQKTESVLVVHR